MRRLKFSVCLAVFAILLVSSNFAQQMSTITVPNLIRYGGTLRDTNGCAGFFLNRGCNVRHLQPAGRRRADLDGDAERDHRCRRQL